MRRLALFLLVLGVAVLAALVVAAALRGEPGPEAPPVGGTETHCFADVCADHPSGWDVEAGDDFLSFAHPLDPERVLGSVGRVNMEALVTNAGGSWPAAADDAARAFFDLLGQFQDAGLDEGPELLPDGSARAAGTLEGLRIWYRVIPVDGAEAIGVEVRAPNDSWAPHADAWRDGLVVGGRP